METLFGDYFSACQSNRGVLQNCIVQLGLMFESQLIFFSILQQSQRKQHLCGNLVSKSFFKKITNKYFSHMTMLEQLSAYYCLEWNSQVTSFS